MSDSGARPREWWIENVPDHNEMKRLHYRGYECFVNVIPEPGAMRVIEKSAYLELSASMCRVLAEQHALEQRLAECKTELERVRDVCVSINREKNSTFEQSVKNYERVNELEAKLAERDAEIERMQGEVVKRNQYKINQEYLDNTHAHYEARVKELEAEVAKHKQLDLTAAVIAKDTESSAQVKKLEAEVARLRKQVGDSRIYAQGRDGAAKSYHVIMLILEAALREILELNALDATMNAHGVAREALVKAQAKRSKPQGV